MWLPGTERDVLGSALGEVEEEQRDALEAVRHLKGDKRLVLLKGEG